MKKPFENYSFIKIKINVAALAGQINHKGRVESGRRGQKSRNFEPKVGKSRNFSVFKVGKSRNFISVFITFLYTGMSNMLVSFADFKANHIIFLKISIPHLISCYSRTLLCTLDDS